MRARNELHYQLERPVMRCPSRAAEDRLATGLHQPFPSKRLEAFMGDYYRHARNIDLIVRAIERRLAIVELPGWQQAIGRWMRGSTEQVIDGFRISDGEINYVQRSVFKDQPRKLMRVFLLLQRHSVRLHPDLSQLIRDNAWRMDRKLRVDPHVHETFWKFSINPARWGMCCVGCMSWIYSVNTCPNSAASPA